MDRLYWDLGSPWSGIRGYELENPPRRQPPQKSKSGLSGNPGHGGAENNRFDSATLIVGEQFRSLGYSEESLSPSCAEPS